jgi:hypothetical protein
VCISPAAVGPSNLAPSSFLRLGSNLIIIIIM